MEDDYIKYQERINHLIKAKKELYETILEMNKIQTKYNIYRKKNPYAKPLNEFRNKITLMRSALMNLIPKRFV